MINVTKPYLPPIDEYMEYLKQIWDRVWLTNQGPLVSELETKMKEYLKIKNLHYVSNGTVALQLAINALDLHDCEIITTPFSFIATTNSILWQGCTPIFVDINPNNYNIDADKIEEKITSKTKAIMAVHVFGIPCDIEKIEKLANKYNLKVIYDAAHTFGVEYNGKSLLNYGDISTCSLHATKVFHTVEGGLCCTNNDEISKKIGLLKNFGYEGENYQEIGINAKNSEFHAAMGLCCLNHLEEAITKRKHISELYDELLNGYVTYIKHEGYKYNYIYYPILFSCEEDVLNCLNSLKENGIMARRYFYPSLNKIDYLEYQSCPISEDISLRIVCLPLDPYLTDQNVEEICNIIKQKVKKN